ncbi:MAG: hypothetical protein D6705_02885 [Deltaproteobacteria bacterium]|nr:MAG: hypothetical protein D6705_02885 [Deltaproteobacteria bacterium]
MTILVVDADRERRGKRAAALGRAGFEVRTADSTDAGMAAAAATRFDVVETRLDLGPGAPCGGLEVAAAAKRRGTQRVLVVAPARSPGAFVARRLGVHLRARPLAPDRLAAIASPHARCVGGAPP